MICTPGGCLKAREKIVGVPPFKQKTGRGEAIRCAAREKTLQKIRSHFISSDDCGAKSR